MLPWMDWPASIATTVCGLSIQMEGAKVPTQSMNVEIGRFPGVRTLSYVPIHRLCVMHHEEQHVDGASLRGVLIHQTRWWQRHGPTRAMMCPVV